MNIDFDKLSPMMRHYFEIKNNYKDCILLYRLGDFYEMFFEDAEVVSKELELTLTGRDCGLEHRAPMCGVPYHAVDVYISRLINKGYKVAICEQLTDPSQAKGMLDRDVVRVITAGTVVEDAILDDKKNNYIASVFMDAKGLGLSWADISTGEFNLVEFSGDSAVKDAENTLNSIHASEIIGNSNVKGVLDNEALYRVPVQLYLDWAYRFASAKETLCKQLGVITLQGFECEDKKLAVCAAGALMQYFIDTQKRALSQFNSLNYVRSGDSMFLDASTRRNLELVETIRDKRKTGTLLWLLDKTKTNMGARCLRNWVDCPLTNADRINNRLASVTELIKDIKLRKELEKSFDNMRDLERLAGKVAFGSVNPREMYGIAQCLVLLPVIKSQLDKVKSPLLSKISRSIEDFSEICDIVCRAISSTAPITVNEGGFIEKGFDKEIDEWRAAESQASEWLHNMEVSERENTGIRTLRINNNKVFGYYIEVSKSFVSMVPLNYVRKQTTVNGERYKTEELDALEQKITGARERAIAKEIKIFHDLKQRLLSVVPLMLSTAKAISALDCLLSFANVSIENKFVLPIINTKIKGYNIVNGRHPVVEKLIEKGKFISNDTKLDSECRTMVITGPNMAGKSTYMRQVALIVLMAHIGCYVPCTKAEIALTDRIFTRVGASDDLTNAQSTFMVEMVEVANILNNASSRSLLILDEIGRGTSTCDGLAIAWSVLEYANKIIKCNTLFATHYHELTQLEGIMEGIKNYRIMVNESGDSVVFLHRIARGGTNKSFGIEVAALAGVPKEVIDRAKTISADLESKGGPETEELLKDSLGDKSHQQVSMFSNPVADEVYNILKETNVNTMTPMQALVALSDLVERTKNGKN